MIPKIIHYCWFGGGEKSTLIKQCIESWKKNAPDFSIVEWNEGNIDVNAYPFTKKMHAEKRWAFVADYVRLIILEREGGIYLDTDMELVAPITSLLEHKVLLGEEEVGIISAGMIGSVPHHPFIRACLRYYDTHEKHIITIPRVLTLIFKDFVKNNDIHVLPPIAFYPFSAETIKKMKRENLTEHTYGIHLWNYSWGHPLNRMFKRLGIHTIGKKITEKLGIKQILKKVFGFI